MGVSLKYIKDKKNITADALSCLNVVEEEEAAELEAEL